MAQKAAIIVIDEYIYAFKKNDGRYFSNNIEISYNFIEDCRHHEKSVCFIGYQNKAYPLRLFFRKGRKEPSNAAGRTKTGNPEN